MSEYDEALVVEFGQRLREIRKKRGLEQARLAEMARVPSSSISHFERGKHKPSFDTLVRLAYQLDVSIDYLVGRTEHVHAHNVEPHERQVRPLPLTDEEIEKVEIYIEYLKTMGRYSEKAYIPREMKVPTVPEDTGESPADEENPG